MGDLKESILKALEGKGILDQIKSELRKQVLVALDEQNGKGSLDKSKGAKLHENPDTVLCLELIRDFLEKYNLDNSLKVFVPESSLGPKPERRTFEREVGITLQGSEPVLLTMLKQLRMTPQSSQPLQKPEPVQKPQIEQKSQEPQKKPQQKPQEPQQKPQEPKQKPQEPQQKPQEKPEPKKQEPSRLLGQLPSLAPLNPKSNFKLANLKTIDQLIGGNSEEEIEESISERIESEEEKEEDYEASSKSVFESYGSSMGVDASVNSLALESLDHIEKVQKPV